MAALTGRTTFMFTRLYIGDTSNVLRMIEINSLSVVGVQYDELDLSAWSDAVKGSLPTWPGVTFEFGGPWSTLAAAAAGYASPSGSHTVLQPLLGLTVPRTIDIQFGIRAAWESGAPQFGISRSATSGVWLKKFDYDPATGMYAAAAAMYPGSELPAWGTAAEV
jgi:hypothetical protein